MFSVLTTSLLIVVIVAIQALTTSNPPFIRLSMKRGPAITSIRSTTSTSAYNNSVTPSMDAWNGLIGAEGHIKLAHTLVAQVVQPGDLVCDATCG